MARPTGTGRAAPVGRLAGGLVLASWLLGCSAQHYREDADETAYAIIAEAQQRTSGETEPFTVERPADTLRRKLLIGQDLAVAHPGSHGAFALDKPENWPEESYPPPPGEIDLPPWLGERPYLLSLPESLGVAARNNRDYQVRKEELFRAALALDLEALSFRHLFSGGGTAAYSSNRTGSPTVEGLANSATASWQRALEVGAVFTLDVVVDLVKLLTQDKASALGLFADMTVSIPLMRGAGSHITGEPLRQAERDVLYALWTFDRFRQTLAVRVATEYLGVLRQRDGLTNAEESYKRLIRATRRVRRLADAGRLPQIQVDQGLQDELRARDRWISAQQEYQARLDGLKLLLGLPADARIELDAGEFDRLVPPNIGAEDRPKEEGGEPAEDAPVELMPPEQHLGRFELDEREAIDIALTERLDLRIAEERIVDAQRGVIVAADALGMGLTLEGSGQVGDRRNLGSATADDARFRVEEGIYSVLLLTDLPIERTAERNAYRQSYLRLEGACRDVQQFEDEIKVQVRDALRQLLQARESYRIQALAVTLAESRIASTELFLEAGRAQIRDVLEAQEALLSAQNARTAALVNYRLAELQLQRDMGVLQVDQSGRWTEYEP